MQWRGLYKGVCSPPLASDKTDSNLSVNILCANINIVTGAVSWAGSGREGAQTRYNNKHADTDNRVNSSVTENIFSFKKIWKKKSNHLIMHLECGYRNMRALFL